MDDLIVVLLLRLLFLFYVIFRLCVISNSGVFTSDAGPICQVALRFWYLAHFCLRKHRNYVQVYEKALSLTSGDFMLQILWNSDLWILNSPRYYVVTVFFGLQLLLVDFSLNCQNCQHTTSRLNREVSATQKVEIDWFFDWI